MWFRILMSLILQPRLVLLRVNISQAADYLIFVNKIPCGLIEDRETPYDNVLSYNDVNDVEIGC